MSIASCDGVLPPLTMDPVHLRALIRERAHHTVEIRLYDALATGKPLTAECGGRVRELLSTWADRGFSTDYPDLMWVKRLLEMVDALRRGALVDLSEFAWQPFSEADRAVARRLVYDRRSVRHWTDEEVPDRMIDQILEAGLWAPHSCNLGSVRFLVIQEKNEPRLFKGSDIPGGPVHIVACQDRRVYFARAANIGHPERYETNRVLDCGAAMQNMVLTAHALGLGAIWLTFSSAMRDRLRVRFALDEHIEVVTYLDVGFPCETPVPPGRIAVQEAVLARV